VAELKTIRNFCIVAHIDHGKSTLADRLLQLTGSIDERTFRDQMLDAMDLERERGITIKCHPVTMAYRAADGATYTLNLIDTPGHVDFTYEVSRSMAACEGVLLLVDAGQGVEAQTVANAYLAMERNLAIIPVINKIDLPNIDIDAIAKQVEDVLAIDMQDRVLVSAKTGQGVDRLLESIVRRVPPPVCSDQPGLTRALVFDSVYDTFRGVVTYVRVVDGRLKAGDVIRFTSKGTETEIKEVGVFSPKPVRMSELGPGSVGYIVSSIREPSEVRIGDTVTLRNAQQVEPLPGFRDVRPMVFSGLYPVDSADYEKFRQSLEKLSLNDSAFTYHPENSVALGFGFRCGFLGLLHMEVVQERLRREFAMDIISTHPAVIFRIHMRSGDVVEIDNPIKLPELNRIEKIEEPMIKAFIICLSEHIGDIMRLAMDRRGEVTRTDSLDNTRVMLTATLPLIEILTDFHDALKSISRGYASMDYEHAGYKASDIVRLDILLNSEPVDAFSVMVHRDKAVYRGRQICEALRDAIPPHMFAVPVQAAIGKQIIARETIKPFRKDVTAKLYGGDITRKRKVLERQKEGKKRMKQYGQVHVPQNAFIAVLRNS
jgi:GTP-binding protein LepA